ncbi:MAG: DinB family protein [Bryobacteraceae bacterium]|jgi:hypothetical protein
MALHLSQRLKTAIAEIEPRLRNIAEHEADLRPGEGAGWNRKQELGHLIDSATNNRVRFLFAALNGSYTAPTYDGNGWVALGGYSDASWADLVELWMLLNMALARAIERIPNESLSAQCTIGQNEPVTLAYLIEDYIRHMSLHLERIAAQT